MSEGTQMGKFKHQDYLHKSHFEKNDSGTMGGRINKINSEYAEGKLLEIQENSTGHDFIEKIFQDSIVEEKFKRWKLCEILATIEDQDNEIDIPSFGKVDSALLGRMVEIWNEEQEKAN